MRTLEFGSEAQVQAQSIIYKLVGLAARRDNVVEFVPELLFIVKAIRHLKLHAEAAE
jgi:hypothetical protein